MSQFLEPIPNLDSNTKKLVILFVFEKMSIPIAEPTLLDICSSENDWLQYMECKQYFYDLLDANFLYRVPKTELYNITQDGINCLSYFFAQIPTSLRNSISNYVSQNRMRFKRKQSYFCDYSKNADGTYTVIMRINTDSATLLDMKLVVSTNQHAKYIYKNWVEKASDIYSMLYDSLLD